MREKKRELQGRKGLDIACNFPLYCFVMLKTKDFEGKMANFKDAASGKSAVDKIELFFDKVECCLEKEDLLEIKNEILIGPMPILLKELVKQIDIV